MSKGVIRIIDNRYNGIKKSIIPYFTKLKK
jgi:hypothetical protein